MLRQPPWTSQRSCLSRDRGSPLAHRGPASIQPTTVHAIPCDRVADPRRDGGVWHGALLGAVLVQPATVARWQREGFRRCWSRRRPGRPRIDSELRTLIGRMATENWLWGAPRIHGELLKLGFTVSERTVSRYLRDRPTRRSQTWRTFLANHVGNLALASTVTPTFAMNTDDAQSSVLPCRPLSRDGRPSNEWALADSLPPLQSPSLRSCTAPAQLHTSTPRRFSSGKDPPRSWVVHPATRVSGRRFLNAWDSVSTGQRSAVETQARDA